MTEAMEAEFDDVAWWTCLAAEELGQDYFIPAGCRGSGGPLALAWLAESCDLRPGSRLLDLGAGVGGPAAWAASRYGVRPLLLDPMPGAGRASYRLFGLPSTTADGTAIPLRHECVDTVWCIGVLCTIEDKKALLNEVHRALRPGGSLGLLVLVAAGTDVDPVPEGNFFPTETELHDSLTNAGFEIGGSIAAPDETPTSWQQRIDQVDDLLRTRHGDHPAYRQAEHQSRILRELLESGQITTRLLHGVRR
ncbi:class I SAM-dependent methyltransferase [Kribbella sp. NBC_01505]|uniref:class I SAM-dependent methyltransferase n=1 Tax=Kribbella sp. NBC_01505 TaxID=2903580 RepID=UPI003867C1A6